MADNNNNNNNNNDGHNPIAEVLADPQNEPPVIVNNGDVQQQEQQDEDENNNPRPAQRPRLTQTFTPMNSNDMVQTRIMTNSSHTDIRTLEMGLEEILIHDVIDLNNIFLVGQIIRLITPSQEEKSSMFTFQRKVKNQTVHHGSGHYHRIILFRNITDNLDSEQNNRVFCLMQNGTVNKHLFDRLETARDNGQCTIGSLLAIVNPEPVDSYMNGIPMVNSSEQAILLNPVNHRTLYPSYNLSAHETKSFVITGAQLQIKRILFLDTKCSGRFCDRQHPEEMKKKVACGCFSNKANRSNLTICFLVVFKTPYGETKIMTNFSSLQFMDIFTKGSLSIDVRAARLQSGNQCYYDFCTSARTIETTINNDTTPGWTFIGWGKRGLMTDAGIATTEAKDDDNKVLSQEVTTHVVHIYPTNRDYLDPTTQKGALLHGLKYNLSQL